MHFIVKKKGNRLPPHAPHYKGSRGSCPRFPRGSGAPEQMSISKRGGGAKWISGRWMNMNNGVKWWEVNAFFPPLLDKNRNYEGICSNKRKSFVKPVGMDAKEIWRTWLT